MPPRIPVLTCLRTSQTCTPSQFTLPLRPFSSTSKTLASQTSRPKKRGSHDPYIRDQQARKKAAFFARKGELREERLQNLGDPVRGITTPFIDSLDTGIPLEGQQPDTPSLNYALTPNSVTNSLIRSRLLAIPRQNPKKTADVPMYQRDQYKSLGDFGRTSTSTSSDEVEESPTVRRENDHVRATEAIKRITALENGSSKDRMRVNISRCVATFGRHNTDKTFPPRAPSINAAGQHDVRPKTNIAAVEKRVGLDTGSSEVQIAILTAKIKTLADFLVTRGKKDKHNKRNLRLLVHRRQKLLQYLRRKERGGPRWQHCIETLGLTEGTWRGEISL